jgi:type IV pilus assembly protein PilY1
MKRIEILAMLMLAFMTLPVAALADDTAMYGGESVALDPNVLIIFDNSGSMDNYVRVGEPYDPGITYTCATCSWDRTKVYYQYSSTSWLQFASIGAEGRVDEAEIRCASARNGLNNDGEWGGNIRWSGSHNCGGSAYYLLRTGNFLNYIIAKNIVSGKKIDIAKNEIIKVIKSTPLKIRWGLMVFNYDEGGYVVSAIKDRGLNCYYDYATYADIPAEDRAGFTEAQWHNTQNLFNTDLINKINAQTASTWTPLAETLAEAGKYYAGAAPSSYAKPSASDTAAFTSSAKTLYDTPIDYRCRSNNVIIITDGMPTQDRGSVLTSTYLNGEAIGDEDSDGCDPNGCRTGMYTDNGSDYLDDVAEFLYNKDLIRSNFRENDSSGTNYGTYGETGYTASSYWQHVRTYAIGFELAPDIDPEILRDACDNGQGQERDSGDGTYFNTGDDIGLSTALRLVLSDIVARNSCYVAPVVPISRTNKTYAGKSLYMGLFSPTEAVPGFWRGNLKKFGFEKQASITDTEVLRDRYGAAVARDSEGNILNSVLTAWYVESSPREEGLQVNKGGAGKVLFTGNNAHSRTFKTYKPGVGMIQFNKVDISPEDLGFAAGETVKRDDLVDWTRAEGIYAPNSGNSRARPWLLGDILHSRPTILFDDTNNTNVVFVGTNDGFMHCFIDNEMDSGDTFNLDNDTLYEAWSFISWEVMTKLKKVPPENSLEYITGDAEHDILVDGTPLIYTSSDKKYLTFGLRRGGSTYYTLDVTNYLVPSRIGEIGSDFLSSRSIPETLGESWSTPYFATIRESGVKKDVILYAGGYDTNQDNSNPGSGDTVGRAIFAVSATSPSVLVPELTFAHSSYNKMTYCIVDLISYDDNNDDCDDVIYATSLGGDVFAFNDKDGNGIWTARWLFHATPEGGLNSKLRKLFYAPGVAQETWGDWVYVGSGDREDPTDENGSNRVSNRFYAIKNKWNVSPWISTWVDGTSADTITDADPNDLVDVTEDILQSTDPGVTIDDKLAHAQLIEARFGWYITLENPGEKVVSSAILYDHVAYFTTYQPTSATVTDPCTTSSTGISRLYGVDYKNGNAVIDSDGDGILEKSDRIIATGDGMLPEPKIVVTEDQTYVVFATEVIPKAGNREIHRYYWQQQP